MKQILCNKQVVQNILAGRQTQDRRPIKPQPDESILKDGYVLVPKPYILRGEKDELRCNIGLFAEKPGTVTIGKTMPVFGYKSKYQPGDVLYVRETFAITAEQTDKPPTTNPILYRADSGNQVFDVGGNWSIDNHNIKWKPSIHMPKWAARIFLKVTAVRVERIQDISAEDCCKEGVTTLTELNNMILRKHQMPFHEQNRRNARRIFKELWDSIYPGSWDRDDWVFVYDFERTEKP